MESCLGFRRRDHVRFVPREFVETGAELVFGDESEFARQIDEDLVVARLGGEKPAVEPDEFRVLEYVRQEPHPLATARLDE